MKKQKITLFISSVAGILLAFTLNYLYRNSYISNGIYKGIAEPLFYISISLFITLLILFFTKEEIFRSWIKFTYIWIPISIFLVLIIPNGGNSSFVSLIDRESVSMLMAGLFFIISLIIVIFGIIKYYYFIK
jgi:hypothetical protein